MTQESLSTATFNTVHNLDLGWYLISQVKSTLPIGQTVHYIHEQNVEIPSFVLHLSFPALQYRHKMYIYPRGTVAPKRLPRPSPYHPSGSSQCTSPKQPVSCIEPGLVICFLYYIIHVLMPFSQITPPTESKRLFYTSVSLLLSRIQGCCYHLSKFCIYALVYCIGVFLSGLLQSV